MGIIANYREKVREVGIGGVEAPEHGHVQESAAALAGESHGGRAMKRCSTGTPEASVKMRQHEREAGRASPIPAGSIRSSTLSNSDLCDMFLRAAPVAAQMAGLGGRRRRPAVGHGRRPAVGRGRTPAMGHLRRPVAGRGRIPAAGRGRRPAAGRGRRPAVGPWEEAGSGLQKEDGGGAEGGEGREVLSGRSETCLWAGLALLFGSPKHLFGPYIERL